MYKTTAIAMCEKLLKLLSDKSDYGQLAVKVAS